jgi:hypothetical protein
VEPLASTGGRHVGQERKHRSALAHAESENPEAPRHMLSQHVVCIFYIVCRNAPGLSTGTKGSLPIMEDTGITYKICFDSQILYTMVDWQQFGNKAVQQSSRIMYIIYRTCEICEIYPCTEYVKYDLLSSINGSDCW